MRFGYDPALVEQFPTVVGGAIHAVGVTNGPSPAALVAAFEAEQPAVLARIGDNAALGDPDAHRLAAGVSRVRRRPDRLPIGRRGAPPTADQAGLDPVDQRARRPRQSRRASATALPVAVFDQRALTGGTTVRFAAGDETFTDLGSGEREAPEPGEVIFVDEAGLVCARRWCWRQSAESASGPDTTEILVTVEGHHEGAHADIEAAIRDLETLIGTYTRPSAVASAILDASAPTFAGIG